MKKVILSAAVIAVGFAGLAFGTTPINHSADELELVQEASLAPGGCVTKNTSETNFTTCNQTYTEDVQQTSSLVTLEKY